jgi:hypothetical protein
MDCIKKQRKKRKKKPPETHQIFNENILNIIIKNINKINYFLMSQWATRGKLLLLFFYPFLLSIWACKSNLKTYYIASHCNPSETQIQIKFTQFSSFPPRALSWTTSKSRLVHNNSTSTRKCSEQKCGPSPL